MRKWLLLLEKRFSVGLPVGLLVGLILVTASFALAGQPIKLIINGKEIQCDVPPQMINGRVMVPARFVAEPLGAEVLWDSAYNAVNIKSQKATLSENEWSSQLTDIIKNKLPKVLNDDSLSDRGKALKIAGIIKDNLAYAPPETLRFEHYCFIQYLFAKQQMFLALDSARSQVGNAISFSQAMAIFDFNNGLADGCYDKFKNYLR